MTNEIVVQQFEFRGDRIAVFSDYRGQFVSFTRICELLKLDPRAEWKKLQEDEEISADSHSDIDPDSGEMVHYLRMNALSAWLFSKKPHELPQPVRAKHAAFRRGLVEAIHNVVAKGVHISSSADPQVVAMELMRYADSNTWMSEHNKLIARSAAMSTLCLVAATSSTHELPVTVASRLQDRKIRLPAGEVSKIGVRVASDYRARTGKEPGTNKQDIKGRLTPVKSYTVADLPHVDRIINEYLKNRA